MPRAAADPVVAEALFREGRRLLDAGHYDEACTKLAESMKQDPASGTLINLASCYEKQGRLATAWASFQAAAVLARQDGRADRVSVAERRASELEVRVPRLIIHVERPLGGMTVEWRGVRLGQGAVETPIPVDPGSYDVQASAPGHVTWRISLRVREGESSVVEIPALTAVPGQTPSPRPERETTSKRGSALVALPQSPDAGQGSFALPVTLAGVGIAAMGLGAFFGVRSLSRYHDADSACPTHSQCTAATLELRHSAETDAWASNGALGVGVAACAVSTWLFFRTARREPKPSPTIAAFPAGLGIALRTPL